MQRSFISPADIIKRNHNGREVLLYGDSKLLHNLLRNSYGISADLVVTGVKVNVSQQISLI